MTVFGAKVVTERDPVILKIANSWLILNAGGGPTDDKPTVTLAPPNDPDHTSAFLNIRVADIAAAYAEWSAKGAEFLTEPKDHGREIRAYIRDPDGHLIEVGQRQDRCWTSGSSTACAGRGRQYGPADLGPGGVLGQVAERARLKGADDRFGVAARQIAARPAALGGLQADAIPAARDAPGRARSWISRAILARSAERRPMSRGPGAR